MTAEEVLEHIRSLGGERNRQGMARFGIAVANAAGVSMASLRPLARQLGKNHALALALWDATLHEARILACMTADPAQATPGLLERWVEALDSWDVCDQFCNKLVVKTPHAWPLAAAWADRPETFVRRAGFSLMAQLAVHDRMATDGDFTPCFESIVRHAGDGRNFVKKAVNWALRQIGKRNPQLQVRAIAVAEELLAMDSKPARWIARDALRELRALPADYRQRKA